MMKRAKRAKKRQAKTLSTPGMGIGLGIAMGTFVIKLIRESILREMGKDASKRVTQKDRVEIDMGQLFNAMNVFIPLMIGGGRRKIVAVRPSKAGLEPRPWRLNQNMKGTQ